MNPPVLLALAEHGRDATVRQLARAVLAGDAAARHGLWDRLQETGEAFMHALQVGQCYLIRTSGGCFTGRVRAVTLTEVVLGEAALVTDPMSYSAVAYIDVLRTGEFAAVYPYPDEVILFIANFLEAARWEHPLPRERKQPTLSESADDDIPF